MLLSGSIIKLFAVISLSLGALQCFFGYKTMKVMIAIWGFLIGAAIGVVIGFMAESLPLGVVLAIFFGAIMAILSYFLYLAGVFFMVTSLTTVLLCLLTRNIYISIFLAAGVGVLAIIFVKPVVIISTSISGAQTILSSVYMMLNVNAIANPVLNIVLWLLVASAGIAVQFLTNQNRNSLSGKAVYTPELHYSQSSFSERKYPGMQRAYRNFCIKCGSELLPEKIECTRCGYIYED